MNAKNFLGALACVVVFFAVFASSEGSHHFLNLAGLAIVLCGTAGAALLSYPFEDLKASMHVAYRSYTTRPATADDIVDTLLDLSLKSRRDGIFALRDDEKRTEVSFLKDALGMMVDGFDKRDLTETLTTETRFFERRRERHERVFRHMARLAPAFGVAGSVVGLIGLLAGVGDTSVILRTIPVALTSTLYGIVLCNLVLIPIAESIHFKTRRELLMQRLVIDGVVAIMEEHNSHRLERKLKSFLTPSHRVGKELSFQEIRQKYLELRPENESV